MSGLFQNVAHDLGLGHERSGGVLAFSFPIFRGNVRGQAPLPGHFFLKIGRLVGDEGGRRLQKRATQLQILAGHKNGVGVEGADHLPGRQRGVALSRGQDRHAQKGQRVEFGVRAFEQTAQKQRVAAHAVHNDRLARGEHLAGDAFARRVVRMPRAGRRVCQTEAKQAGFGLEQDQMGTQKAVAHGQHAQKRGQRSLEGTLRAHARGHEAQGFEPGTTVKSVGRT